MDAQIIFAVLGALLLACKSGKTQDNNSAVQFANDTLYLEKTCICTDRHMLKVRTSYFLVPDSINSWGWIALSQELVYQKDGEIIKSVHFPFKKHLYQDSISVLSTTLRQAKCVSRGDSVIIQLYGAYHTDPPHEFFALTSIEGNWLYYYYGSMHEIYDSYGEEAIYETYFGREVNSLKHMTRISP